MLFSKKQKEALAKRAYYDRITGLPTHAKFEQAFENLPDGARGYVYVLVRAEEYRRVRETLGRDTADLLLKGIADLLYEQLQEGEAAARVGGGDFAMLLLPQPQQELEKRLTGLNERLVKLPVICRVRDQMIRFGYHITYRTGVLILGRDGQPIEEAERLARGAEQMARAKGKLFEIFDQTRPTTAENRNLELMMDIDRALAQEEFVPYVQPEYSFKTGRIAGAEILVRWNHPEEGPIDPDDFLPLMEYDGRIFELDLYMLERACRLIQGWVAKELMPVPLSINISRLSLYREDFVERAVAVARKYDVPTVLIVFELEESAIFDAPELVTRVIHALHDEGFRLMIDNFGRGGFSAMHHIGQLPVDGIKPVKGFFRTDGVVTKREKIVMQHLVQMSEELSQTLIFAHMETKEQVDLLRSLGGLYVQGHLFEDAFPIERFEEVLFGAASAHQDLLGISMGESDA